MSWKTWIGPVLLAIVAALVIVLCTQVAKGMRHREAHGSFGAFQQDVEVAFVLGERGLLFATQLAAFALIAAGAMAGFRQGAIKHAVALVGLGAAIWLVCVIAHAPEAWAAPVALVGLITGACVYGVLTRASQPAE